MQWSQHIEPFNGAVNLMVHEHRLMEAFPAVDYPVPDGVDLPALQDIC